MIRFRASALIVENNQLLVIKHKKQQRQYYLLPGGGVDLGETIESALKREMLEELNVRIEVGDLVYLLESISPDQERHIISVVLECKLLSREFQLGDDERLAGYRFLTLDELQEETFYPDFKKDLIAYIKKTKLVKRVLSCQWKK